MKLTDNDRSDLLESLFSSGSAPPVRAEDVLGWIEKERKLRQLRLRYASISLVALFLTASSVIFLPRNETVETVASASSKVVSPGETPATPTESARLVVERVDDEALMGLLDDTPSALVAWPDGRRSLLVVVRQTEL